MWTQGKKGRVLIRRLKNLSRMNKGKKEKLHLHVIGISREEKGFNGGKA